MDSPDHGSDSAAWLMDGTPTSDLPVALPFFFPWNNNKSGLCGFGCLRNQKTFDNARDWDRWAERIWMKTTLSCPFTSTPPSPPRESNLFGTD